ncbi:hypothetical protein AAFF_G00365050 [Aldrovandia affinis]|uniref:Protein kinase domain-containing protein n=1 Tax=Aldrovandia affinis TaxID=143900 RepID=A0AAD7R566_9TELE|nr:hypothetical protein AAFF_G00365050 [Aldrovandia affinis]
MEISVCPAPVLIGNSGLQSWSVIGSGGFGQIYKAKYKDLGMDVAIKLLHNDDGSSLQKEAERMLHGGSPFVLRVLAVYRGVPPGRCGPPQRGLVMEFMERGSVESLLQRLGGAPPWPLAFRLCHQVALGMNYLHRLSPPLLHLDLKPPNVLLDDGLCAKLTDFGLARFDHTVSNVGQEEEGGTLSYMPPEAFDLSYQPRPASDSYSYAIFLWSVITGKQPYSGALSCIVRFRIREGDRPSLDQLDRSRVEGLGEIADLMVKCWDPSPQKRPSFRDCLPVTEKVFELHKPGIKDAVHQVMTSLDLKTQRWACRECEAPDYVRTGPVPAQETGGDSSSKPKVKASVPPHPIRMLSAEPFLHSANHTPPVTRSSSNQSLVGSCQGQCCSRTPVQPSAGGLVIKLSNVTGLQVGDNNTMTITTSNTGYQRHRHPTAPPTFNTPASQPGKPFQ